MELAGMKKEKIMQILSMHQTAVIHALAREIEEGENSYTINVDPHTAIDKMVDYTTSLDIDTGDKE